jgi:hypothetical protein
VPKQEILVSIITPKPKPCLVRIEYEEVSEELQDIASIIWPNEPQPFMMPYLVCEDTGGTSNELEKPSLEAFGFLMGRAMLTDVSPSEFSESLVWFCKKFGRLFTESRISVMEARERVGWQWWFLIILQNSIKKGSTNKGYIALLRRNVYDPYTKALSNHPDHEGNFVIDFVVFDPTDDKAQFLAHPAKKDSEGFILPSKNKRPKTDYNDEVVPWCQNVALMNLNRFLKKNIRYVTKYDGIHGLTLNLKLKDQYTSAVLQFLDGKIDWLNPSNIAVLKGKQEFEFQISEARSIRRGVLAGFRNRTSETRPVAENNRITKQEYCELRTYSEKLLCDHLDKEEMYIQLDSYLKDMRKKEKRK